MIKKIMKEKESVSNQEGVSLKDGYRYTGKDPVWL